MSYADSSTIQHWFEGSLVREPVLCSEGSLVRDPVLCSEGSLVREPVLCSEVHQFESRFFALNVYQSKSRLFAPNVHYSELVLCSECPLPHRSTDSNFNQCEGILIRRSIGTKIYQCQLWIMLFYFICKIDMMPLTYYLQLKSPDRSLYVLTIGTDRNSHQLSKTMKCFVICLRS